MTVDHGSNDHLFVRLQLAEVNFYGLIMQLEKHFSKIMSILWLFVSKNKV